MKDYLDISEISDKKKTKLFTFLNELLFDIKNENLLLRRSELVDILSIELGRYIIENNNIDVFVIEYVDSMDDENKKKIVIEKLINNDMTTSLYNKIYQQTINSTEISIENIIDNQISVVKEAVFQSCVNTIETEFKAIRANKHLIAITGSSNVEYKFEEGERLIHKYLSLIYTYSTHRAKIQSLFLDFSVLRDKIKTDFFQLKQILDFIDDNSVDTTIGNDVTYLEVEKFTKKVETEYDKLKDRLQYFNKIVDQELDGVVNNLISNLESKFKGYNKKNAVINSERLKSDAVGMAASFAVDLALSTYKTRQESKKTIALLEKDIEIIKNTFIIDVSNFFDDFYRLFEIYTDVRENYIPNAVKFFNVLNHNKETDLKELFEVAEHYEIQPLWKERIKVLSKIKFLNTEIEQTSKIIEYRQNIFTDTKEKNEFTISQNNSLIDTLDFQPGYIDLLFSFGMYNFVYNTFLKEKIDNQIENCKNENTILKLEIEKCQIELDIPSKYYLQIETDKKAEEENLTELNKEILDKVSKIQTHLNIEFYQNKIAFLEEHFNNILKIDIDEELKTPENYRKSVDIISNYQMHSPEDLDNFEYQSKYVKMYALINSIKHKTIEKLDEKIMNLKLDDLEIDESIFQDIEEGYVQKSLALLDKIKDIQLGNDTVESMLNAEVTNFVSENIRKHTDGLSNIDNYEAHVAKASLLFIDYFKDLNQILKTKEVTDFYKNLNEYNSNELKNRKLQLDERLKNKYQKNITNGFNKEDF